MNFTCLLHAKITRNTVQVTFGERFGCIGMILYTDPSDYALEGVDNVYPDSWWMPGTGVQRGTVKNEGGDPLTPYYPAIGKFSRCMLFTKHSCSKYVVKNVTFLVISHHKV